MSDLPPPVYLAKLAAEARDLDQAGFVARYPHPSLVLEPFAAVTDDTQFETVRSGGTGAGRRRVVPIVKRDAALFATMISLGRAKSCDLVLDAQSVSRFHGYFAFDAEGALSFTDGKSTAGTVIAGERLEGGTRPTPPGTRIRFGTVEATVMSPEQLYDEAYGYWTTRVPRPEITR